MTDPTPAAQPAAPFNEAEDKQYATLATFLNIILLIPGLVFYLVFKDRGPKIGEQSKENLNWTINVTALYIICLILEVIPFIGLLFFVVTFLLGIANLIFAILGGLKLNSTGETYRYPVNIRWIK